MELMSFDDKEGILKGVCVHTKLAEGKCEHFTIPGTCFVLAKATVDVKQTWHIYCKVLPLTNACSKGYFYAVAATRSPAYNDHCCQRYIVCHRCMMIAADRTPPMHRRVAEEKAALEQQLAALRDETKQECIKLKLEVDTLSYNLQAAESAAEAGCPQTPRPSPGA